MASHGLSRGPEVATTLFLFLPFLLSIASGCGRGRGEGWVGETVVEDGVPHLYNPDQPLWGADYRPLAEREVLGGPASPVDAVFAEPVVLVCGPDGTRYILDGKDARILRFAPDGSYLGSFGRQGEGPGEFQNLTGMTLMPDGDLLVADDGSRRLSRFSVDGEFLGSVTLQRALGQIVASRTGGVYMHPQPRTMVVSLQLGISGPDEEPTLIDVLTPQGERTGGFGVIEEYEGMLLGSWMNKVQPALAPGDSLIANYLGRGLINIYAPDGTLARVVHRNQPFEPVEPVEESVQTEQDDGSVSISMRFEFDILSTGFAVHPDGRWWAALVALTQQDRRPGIEEEDEIPQEWAVDLFDESGRWLARHPLGTDYPLALLDWGPDGLYVLNPYGDATIHRFEVVPPS